MGKHVSLNEFGDNSIDFSNPVAVKTLNKALLKYYYGIDFWDIPPNYLCPPIPGRADYIHHIAELLQDSNNRIVPLGNKIKCLDIGVGANCIYPILGFKEYGWSFVGSDIDSVAIKSATKIISSNSDLCGKIDLRLQKNPNAIFKGIIGKNELFDLTICNPPFHSSLEEAKSGTLRKLSNLNRKKVTKAALNFGGKNNELFCEGGEKVFVNNMIAESKQVKNSCLWFSTLISKKENLKRIYSALEYADVSEVKTLNMKHGNKMSRVVAWTFFSKAQQNEWVKSRW